jgi:serine/threonine kinase 16
LKKKNGNLQEELDTNNKNQSMLKLSRLTKIFYAITSGLNYIHENNLAHRDLKPQNVLLSSDERVQALLTDFGSMTERVIEVKNSKKAQEIQDFSAQNCSMFYKAPELFNVRIGLIDEKADIWSLGCVLYALMFNKGPFDYVAEKGNVSFFIV